MTHNLAISFLVQGCNILPAVDTEIKWTAPKQFFVDFFMFDDENARRISTKGEVCHVYLTRSSKIRLKLRTLN